MKVLNGISILLIVFYICGCGTTGDTNGSAKKRPLIIKESVLFPDKTVEEYTFYTYNKANTILLKTERFNNDNNLIESVVYKYSGAKITKKTNYDNDRSIMGYHIYVCNTEGLIITDITYNDKNEIQSKSIYEYDLKGRKKKWQVFDGADVFLGHTNYIYDKNGNNIKIENYNVHKVLAEYFLMEYNEKNFLIKKSSYFNGKLYGIIKYEYNNEKLTKETFFNVTNIITRKNEYAYSGNKATITHYSSGGTRVTNITIREYNKHL